MNKYLLGAISLGIGFFVTSAQATDNIYKIDTNGAEDSIRSLADISNPRKTSVDYLNVKPSATVWLLAGKQQLGMGQGMLPFGGNGIDDIFYGALEADVSLKKNTGFASGGAGGGYRKIFNDSYLMGGYMLADYNRSPAGNKFWVSSFGVEVLNYSWDLRVNGYIPIGKKRWKTTTGVYEETATGFDAEIGRVLPVFGAKGLKLFVGSYHYFMSETDKIFGAEARLVWTLTNFLTVEVRDSYDGTRYNTAMGGLRFTFGGYNNENKANLGISGRMSDPIEHNFANFANCNSSVINKK